MEDRKLTKREACGRGLGRADGSTSLRVDYLRFILGTAQILFSFAVVYKLIPFYVITPLLFVALVMVLFPLGALLAGLTSLSAPRLWSLVLWGLTAAFVLMHLWAPWRLFTGAGLSFDISLAAVFARSGAVLAVLAPLVVAAGALEYLLFDGMARKHGSFNGPYVVLVSVALLAFAAGTWIPLLAGIRVLIGLTLAIGAAFFAASGGRRWVLIAGLLLSPAVAASVDMIDLACETPWNRSGEDRCSLNDENVLFSAWRPAGFFVLRGERSSGLISGGYNGLLLWDTRRPSQGRDLDLLALELIEDPVAPVAIIGAGGGRQLAPVDDLGLREVHAVDIEAVIPEVLSRTRAQGFRSRYDSEAIRFHAMTGRRFLAGRDDHSLGMIMLADAGNIASLVQTILSPASMMNSLEAYRLYRRKMRPEGSLVFWANFYMPDPDAYIAERVATMRAAGFAVQALRTAEQMLIIGVEPHRADHLRELISDLGADFEGLRPVAETGAPTRVPLDDTLYSGLTCLGSYQRVVRSLVAALVVMLLVTLLAAGGVYARWWRGRTDRFSTTLVSATMTGMIYYFLQILVIVHLANRLMDLFQAVFLGLSIFFLAYLVVNAALMRLPPRLQILASLLVVLIGGGLTVAGRVEAGAVVCVLSGAALFPILFSRRGSEQRLTVFVFDSLGAGIGTILGVLVPFVWGLGVFQMAVAVLVGIVLVILYASINPALRRSPSPV